MISLPVVRPLIFFTTNLTECLLSRGFDGELSPCQANTFNLHLLRCVSRNLLISKVGFLPSTDIRVKNNLALVNSCSTQLGARGTRLVGQE